MNYNLDKIVYVYLKVLCGILVLMYCVFRIGISLVNQKPLYLDRNDGYVLLGCVSVLLSIKAIKAATEAYVKRKSKNIN